LDLKFSKRSYGPVHIDISFKSRDHGDNEGFDGEGGVLAHSFYPLYGGDVHFDDDEMWKVGNKFKDAGISLKHVAAHEFGHALGLPHLPHKEVGLNDGLELIFPDFAQVGINGRFGTNIP
ncbi:matrilysin-like, partial [Eurytemora carolleeae]|uniref:matrilysin-like n=1 Tax=Eurytemora carolleeae TaxID=1294199 RepID=UPI000C77CB2C